MHHVVEILQIALVRAKADGAQIGENVAHVVEQHATDVLPNSGKRHSVWWKRRARPPNGKPVGGVARARLISGKARFEPPPPPKNRSGKGMASSGSVIAPVRRNGNMTPKLSLARQHGAFADGVISCIARQAAHEVDLRAEDFGGKPEIDGVVDTLVSIDRIVAAVLNIGAGEHAHAHWLGEQRHQQGIDLQIIGFDPAVAEAVQEAARFGQALRQLNGAFQSLGRKRFYIRGLIIERCEARGRNSRDCETAAPHT